MTIALWFIAIQLTLLNVWIGFIFGVLYDIKKFQEQSEEKNND